VPPFAPHRPARIGECAESATLELTYTSINAEIRMARDKPESAHSLSEFQIASVKSTLSMDLITKWSLTKVPEVMATYLKVRKAMT
jgi:hypothetical protein